MNKAIWFVPSVLLLLALAPMPYDYYTMLRFVVCGASGYLAWRHFAVIKLHPWTVGLIAMAILFNPIIPIRFSRGIWAAIDVGCALVFLVNMKKMRKILSS
jgi:hypothetical protein